MLLLLWQARFSSLEGSEAEMGNGPLAAVEALAKKRGGRLHVLRLLLRLGRAFQ